MRRAISLLVILLVASCAGEVPSAVSPTTHTTTTTATTTTATIPPTTTTTASTTPPPTPTTTATTAMAATTTTIPLLVPIPPPAGSRLAVDSDEVWVSFGERNTVWLMYPPEDQSFVREVCGGFNPRPHALALSPKYVWVTCRSPYSVVAIDRSTREVAATIDVDDPLSLAVSDGVVWVAAGRDHAIWVLDPGHMAVATRIPLPGLCDRPVQVLATGERIWVVTLSLTSCPGFSLVSQSRLHIIDPNELEITWSSDQISSVEIRLTAADGEVWASGLSDGVLTVLDAITAAELAEVGPDLGRSSRNHDAQLAASEGYVWLINQASGGAPREIVIIDQATRSVVKRIPTQSSVVDVAADDRVGWLLLEDGLAVVTP